MDRRLAVYRLRYRAADGAESGGRGAAHGGRKAGFSGIWQVLNTAAWDIQDHSASLGVPAGQGVVEGNEIPYQPWAATKKRENYENRRTADPEARCFQPGVPRITYMPFPFQIVQTPTYIAILYEVRARDAAHLCGRHTTPERPDR